MKRRLVSILFAFAVMTTSVAGCTGTNIPASEVLSVMSESASDPSEYPSEVTVEEILGHEYIKAELSESNRVFLECGTDLDDFYTELNAPEGSMEFPESFDLRDENLIPEVRDQNPWGTCWSFATIAACESSLLSTLGLNLDEYKEKYDEELNLSEKHLAYFGELALPDANQYPEGEYPYNIDQAGEGVCPLPKVKDTPLDIGGNYFE